MILLLRWPSQEKNEAWYQPFSGKVAEKLAALDEIRVDVIALIDGSAPAGGAARC